jgi:hypothetical protein
MSASSAAWDTPRLALINATDAVMAASAARLLNTQSILILCPLWSVLGFGFGASSKHRAGDEGARFFSWATFNERRLPSRWGS